MTQLTLTRLPRRQSEEMVVRVTGGKPVPAEVLAQIVPKPMASRCLWKSW